MRQYTKQLIVFGLGSLWLASFAAPDAVVQSTVSTLLFLGLAWHVYACWGQQIRTYLMGGKDVAAEATEPATEDSGGAGSSEG